MAKPTQPGTTDGPADWAQQLHQQEEGLATAEYGIVMLATVPPLRGI